MRAFCVLFSGVSCTFIEIDDEIKPSPTKQARLQTFFKSPSKEFADSEIRLPVLATSPKITAAARHDAVWQQICYHTDQPFVANGSRDRWGCLRKNVGGRPKKQKIEGKLPRAYSGQRRKEFQASEKLQMIKQIKTFERLITEEFSEESKDRRAQRLNEVVTREVPAMACTRKRRRLMEEEARLRQIVNENKLSERFGQFFGLGGWNAVKLKRGQYKARGVRAAGAGRKNEFLR